MHLRHKLDVNVNDPASYCSLVMRWGLVPGCILPQPCSTYRLQTPITPFWDRVEYDLWIVIVLLCH